MGGMKAIIQGMGDSSRKGCRHSNSISLPCMECKHEKEIKELEGQNKVLWDGLEACEIYLRETGAIVLAVEMKNILAKAKSTESGGGQ